MKPYYTSPAYASVPDWHNFFVICSECQSAIPVVDAPAHDVWHEKFDMLFQRLGDLTQCPECYVHLHISAHKAHAIWHEYAEVGEDMEEDDFRDEFAAPVPPIYINTDTTTTTTMEML